ncbi:GNAT family N-acetyltransferase [Anaerobacillus alkaliphilus]|uniref:GNAT family N-acetyltransferase n=1 Tax=Anaerobacillus alkaliphilus TaxID=1548597 RepID=A0A4Q0VP51_9BACI|nr:GNAT family N-acetyltransferase [Anaerobacillus alkaliphilus]RXI96642.1 GNAT family N-acetyltransferase [Anaerobacillus alkaliphilus]
MNVRKATVNDAKGIAKVHVDSWRTTYQSIIPEEFLNNLSYERREKLWVDNIQSMNVYIAESDKGEIIGFSSGGKERSGSYPGYDGELYAIYILQEYQGQGVGKKLVEPVVEELLSNGVSSMLVLVLEDNPSCRFYEALGAKKLDTIEVVIAGKKLSEAVYGWVDINRLT